MTESYRPPHQPGERDTTPRYSLAYELIGSDDTIVRHPGGGSARIVSYPQARGRKSVIREVLLGKGLILGRVRSEIDDKEQQFIVPTSARPIAYDARVDAPGAFSYNDEQLFFDLGNLLGELYLSDQEEPVVVGNIGRAVALVEFTRPNERQLYFVPGIERIIETLPVGFEPSEYYTDSLMQTFGHRFDLAAVSFRMGFSEAVAQ